MSEALPDDLAPLGIGVSVICPGFVKTDLWESERNRPARYSKAVGKPRDAHDEMRIAAANAMDPDFFGQRILASIKWERTLNLSGQICLIWRAGNRLELGEEVNKFLLSNPQMVYSLGYLT